MTSSYTQRELVVFVLQDLLTDIRSAVRDDRPLYAAKCRVEFRRIWPTRHTPHLDRYGWPSGPNDYR